MSDREAPTALCPRRPGCRRARPCRRPRWPAV